MVDEVSSPDTPRRTRLVVLYGGRSAEHEVSCISAFNLVSAVDRDRYDLRLVGMTTDGRWVDTTDVLTPSALAGGGAKTLPSPDAQAGSAVVAAGGAIAGDLLRGGELGGGDVVVFPLVHGPMGEDGTLQGLLELAGLPYCGPGVAGSATAMDKGLAKALFTAAGLPQARYLYRHEHEVAASTVGEVEHQLGWPVFVKPANMGSSIGISKVKDPGGLQPALERAFRYDSQVVIEEAVSGRELEMGVLGWPELRTSVPGEIKPSHDFYDFEDKYLEGAAGLDIPARLPAGVAEEMGRLAVEACRALRVDSMARVDFFFEEGGRGLLINEVNTIPGFTPISMYPRMWAESGIPYPALLDTLVDQAIRRAERRRRFETGR